MSYFLKRGNVWMVQAEAAMDLYKALPPGNYVPIVLPMSEQLALERVDDFIIPKRVYGSLKAKADRIVRSFMDRPLSTGVLLAGEKGSGKSLLAKMLAVLAAELKLPTIVVNQPYGGDGFNKLIQGIGPAVVLFDEFEKTYPKKYGDSDEQGPSQTTILTLLDGVFPTRKLFILTCNDYFAIDSHMLNRPGRLYYALEFAGLEQDAVVGYCKDNLQNPANMEQVLKVAGLFEHFNFDMLQALVEEMNRFNEPAISALDMLNIKPDSKDEASYDIVVLDKTGKDVTHPHLDDFYGSPLRQTSLGIHYRDGNDQKRLSFTQAHLDRADLARGKYVYKVDGFTVIYTRQRQEPYDYRRHLA